METSMQSWSGVDKPVDAALMFNCFINVEPADRQALIRQLFSQHLAPNGVVITIETGDRDSGFMHLMERLGNPQKDYYYDEVERDMLAAGFSLVCTQAFKGSSDLSNPSEDLMKYVQLSANNQVSEQEVRAAIADIYGSTEINFYSMMGVFKK